MVRGWRLRLSLDMTTNIFIDRGSFMSALPRFMVLLLELFVLFFVCLVLCGCENRGGYSIVDVRSDDVYLTRNGKIIVGSTIADWRVVENYLYGIRIPIRYLSCDSGGYSVIRLTSSREYFIVDKDTGNVVKYAGADEFFRALYELLGTRVEKIDLDKVERLSSRYFEIYARSGDLDLSCKDFPLGTSERGRSLEHPK